MSEFKPPKKLWKTTLIIWSDFDPHEIEIDHLAKEAVSGMAYCSKDKKEHVTVAEDKDWDGTEFFDTRDEDEDEDGED